MTPRRTLPAVPFWAMLAALWALLVLGAAPAMQADALCGSARHGAPAHHDGIACCPCTLSGPLQALAAAPPDLPAPRGTPVRVSRPTAVMDPAASPAPPAHARSPPAAA